MAHLIGEKDHMLSVGQVPWHGLGTVLKNHPNTAEAMKIARLDWTVEKVPLTTYDGIPVEGHCVMRRIDMPNHILGVVTEDYEPVQNVDAFAIGDILLGADNVHVETAGSLRECRTVWMLFRLSGQIAVAGDDTIETYLLATTSHDGTQALTWMPTSVRVVCNNTLSFALRDIGRSYRFVHRESIRAQMDDAERFIRWVMSKSTNTIEEYREMTKVQVGSAEVDRYFKAVFPTRQTAQEMIEMAYGSTWYESEEEADSSAERKANKVRRKCLELLESGRGSNMPGSRGTVWGALNAVTEYIDHGCGRKQTQEQAMWRRLYGSGAEIKRRAYREAESLMDEKR